MAHGRLTLGTILLLVLTLAPSVFAAPGRSSVLADLRVDEPVEGDVVVLGADLDLGPNAVVSGDAVVVGGSIRIAAGAEVAHHVVAVLGHVDVDRDAVVGGRVLPLASVASLASSSGSIGPSLRFALRLLTSGGWLAIATLLAFFAPVRMRYGTWSFEALGLKVPLLGVMVFLTWFAALVAVLGLGPGLGPPLIALLWLLFFAAKSAGLTVVGGWLGGAILRRFSKGPLPITLEVFAGVLVLLALRFLPVVGGTLWTFASLAALGAAVAVLAVEPRLPRVDPASP